MRRRVVRSTCFSKGFFTFFSGLFVLWNVTCNNYTTVLIKRLDGTSCCVSKYQSLRIKPSIVFFSLLSRIDKSHIYARAVPLSPTAMRSPVSPLLVGSALFTSTPIPRSPVQLLPYRPYNPNARQTSFLVSGTAGKKLPKVSEISRGSKYFRKSVNNFRKFPMFPNVSECFQMFPDVSKIFPHVSKCFQIFPKCSQCFQKYFTVIFFFIIAVSCNVIIYVFRLTDGLNIWAENFDRVCLLQRHKPSNFDLARSRSFRPVGIDLLRVTANPQRRIRQPGNCPQEDETRRRGDAPRVQYTILAVPTQHKTKPCLYITGTQSKRGHTSAMLLLALLRWLMLG